MRPNSPIADDHGVFQQAAVVKVFQQRGVGHVEHGSDEVAITTDGAEGLGAVDVPGDLVEDRLEHVDGDEAHAGFNHAPREKAALAEAIHAVLLANFVGLAMEFEGFAGLLR